MSIGRHWDNLAAMWQMQGPPATPSDEDIELIHQMVCSTVRKPKKIAILGSTPAIRTKMRIEWPDSTIYVVDVSTAMYEVTTKHVAATVRHQETFVSANWLACASFINDVDAIIGDKSLDNVDLNSWPQFFQEMANAMRVGGILVLHVGLADAALKGRSFQTIAEPWVQRTEAADVNFSDAAAGLWEDLLSGSATGTGTFVSLQPYLSNILEHSRDSGTLGRLCLELLASYEPAKAQWAYFTLEDIRTAAAREGLRLIHMATSSDYAAAPNQPILGLVRGDRSRL